MQASTEAAIWQRLIQPDGELLTREAAEGLLRLQLSPADRNRMCDLATKANEGTLTAEEEHEIESYRRVGYLLDLIHSRARRSLEHDNDPD